MRYPEPTTTSCGQYAVCLGRPWSSYVGALPLLASPARFSKVFVRKCMCMCSGCNQEHYTGLLPPPNTAGLPNINTDSNALLAVQD